MDRYLLETIVNEWHKVHTRKKKQYSTCITVNNTFSVYTCNNGTCIKQLLLQNALNTLDAHKDTFRTIFLDAAT